MEELFFKDKVSAKIFYLTQLSGETQMKFLGIAIAHYSNKKLAEKWRDEQLKVLKNCEHGFKDLAIEKLEKIYKGMGGKI